MRHRLMSPRSLVNYLWLNTCCIQEKSSFHFSLIWHLFKGMKTTTKVGFWIGLDLQSTVLPHHPKSNSHYIRHKIRPAFNFFTLNEQRTRIVVVPIIYISIKELYLRNAVLKTKCLYLPKIPMLKHNSQYAVGPLGGHWVETLMDGISILIKDPKSMLIKSMLS